MNWIPSLRRKSINYIDKRRSVDMERHAHEEREKIESENESARQQTSGMQYSNRPGSFKWEWEELNERAKADRERRNAMERTTKTNKRNNDIYYHKIWSDCLLFISTWADGHTQCVACVCSGGGKNEAIHFMLGE